MHKKSGSNSSNEGGDRDVHKARRMFKALRKANPHLAGDAGIRAALDAVEHDDDITQDELIQKLVNSEIEHEVSHDGANSIVSEEEEENNFVETLVGESDSGTGNATHGRKKRKMRHLARKKIDSFIDFVVAKINQQWLTIAYAVFPVQQVQTLILVCFVQFISINTIFALLPIICAYGAFICMVYNTLKMFHNKSVKKEQQAQKLRKRLLDLFSDEPHVQEHEEKTSMFVTVSWDAYVKFMLAVIVFACSVGAADKYLPHSSLLCVVSAFFSLVSFVALADQHDHYAFFAISANFISFFPTLLARMHLSIGFWKIWKPVLHMTLGFFVIDISFPSIALLSIPVAYFLMVRNMYDTWSERLHFIVPHVVCVVWADIAMTLWMIGWRSFSQFDLFLSIAIVLLTFIPMRFFLWAIGAFFAIITAQLRNQINWISFAKAAVTLVALASPFALSKLYIAITRNLSLQRNSNYSRKRIWIFATIYFAILAIVVSCLYQGQLTLGSRTDTSNMTWLQFEKHCAPRVVPSGNMLRTQIECSQLKGTAVAWQGTLQSVRISSVENPFESLLAYIPDSLAQYIRCFYDTDYTHIVYYSGMSPNQCSLTAHNVYTFEIDVAGPYGNRVASSSKGQLVLSAKHVFGDMLRLLEESDIVAFTGFFDNYPIFKYPPKLRLLRLQCIHCRQFQGDRNSALRVVSTKLDRNGLWQYIYDAFKFTFHFVFAPFARIR